MDVVPLYGDMQMKPYFYITKSLNFDPSRWSHCESSQPSPQAQILSSLESLREGHTEYVSELARRSNQVITILHIHCVLVTNLWIKIIFGLDW